MCLCLLKIGFALSDIKDMSLTMAMNFVAEHNDMMDSGSAPSDSTKARAATQQDIQAMLA